MFIFLHYSGGEPRWASELVKAGFPVYSPARPIKDQLARLEPVLEGVKPNVNAYEYADAFKLGKEIWKPISQVKQVLVDADKFVSTEHCIWRDQWLLSRSDILLTENGASLDIPVLAYLLDIRTVSISFIPTWISPWLAKASQITINNPQSVEEIISVLNAIGSTEEKKEPAPDATEN